MHILFLSDNFPPEVNAPASRTFEHCREWVKAGHRVTVDCPDGIVMDSYPGALSQVLSNFVMNSLVHGFDPGTGGAIAITVDRPASGQIRMIYSDNGRGIAPDHRGRIFDPFFTTRRGAGGSGLGLHIVYNLVTGPLIWCTDWFCTHAISPVQRFTSAWNF